MLNQCTLASCVLDLAVDIQIRCTARGLFVLEGDAKDDPVEGNYEVVEGHQTSVGATSKREGTLSREERRTYVSMERQYWSLVAELRSMPTLPRWRSPHGQSGRRRRFVADDECCFRVALFSHPTTASLRDPRSPVTIGLPMGQKTQRLGSNTLRPMQYCQHILDDDFGYYLAVLYPIIRQTHNEFSSRQAFMKTNGVAYYVSSRSVYLAQASRWTFSPTLASTIIRSQ